MTDRKKDGEVRRVDELLAGFDTAMLVTRDGKDELRARPMALAETVKDGNLYFSTALDSPKVAELRRDPRVVVTLQAPGRYVSLSGVARIVSDRALIDELWSETWRVWFPQGKGDPTLCVLAVEPQVAEYWDQSGVKGLKYLYKAAEAYVTGTRPSETDTKDHAKIVL